MTYESTTLVKSKSTSEARKATIKVKATPSDIESSDAIDMLEQSFDNKLNAVPQMQQRPLQGHPWPPSPINNTSTFQSYAKPQKIKRTVKKAKALTVMNDGMEHRGSSNAGEDLTSQEIYQQIIQLQSELGYYEQIIGKRSALNPVEVLITKQNLFTQ